MPRVRLAPSNAATKGDESTTRANIEADRSDFLFPFSPERIHTTNNSIRYLVHSHPKLTIVHDHDRESDNSLDIR